MNTRNSALRNMKAAYKDPAERAFVRKLDTFLLTFGCISQVIKYLDQQNINNAYVSGMQEDLNLSGNELNYFTTTFNIAYCVMLIPSQIIMTHVRPSLWLSCLEITWGFITALMAFTTSAKQIYVLRVGLGLCESSAWPGMMTLLMHWYTPNELAKRMAIYHSCQAVGGMVSGALQAAIMNTLADHAGLAGWRWLFVINALITVIWGFFGLFMLPDYPNDPNPRAFWLDPSTDSIDIDLALDRLNRHNRALPNRICLSGVKRTLKTPLLYSITILFTTTVLASYGYNYFVLFLKSLKTAEGTPTWSISAINLIPLIGGLINVFCVWFWAFLSDHYRTRWPLIIAQAVIGLGPAIAMSIWTSQPRDLGMQRLGIAYASYIISYACLGTAPLIFAWLSDLMPSDPEGRSLIVGVAVASCYAVLAWWQALVWPVREAPYYRFGWQSCVALWVCVVGVTLLLKGFGTEGSETEGRTFASAGRQGGNGSLGDEVTESTALWEREEEEESIVAAAAGFGEDSRDATKVTAEDCLLTRPTTRRE